MSQNTKHNNSTQETETVTWQKAQCQTEKYLSIYKRNHGMTRNTVSAHKEHLSMYLHILFLALKRQLHMYIHNQSRSSNSLQVTTTTSRHSSILTLLWVEFYTLLWFWRSTCINVCSCINFSLSLFSPSSLVTHTYVDSLTAYGVMRPSDTQKNVPQVYLLCILHTNTLLSLWSLVLLQSPNVSSWLWNPVSHYQEQSCLCAS